MNAQVLGISVDSVPCLKAWAETFNGITYPLLSDFWPHGAVAQQYGVLRSEGHSERALFVIDKFGVICYIDIHDIDHQPENEVLLEVLRRIDPEAAAREPKPVRAAPSSILLPHGGVVMYCTSWCPGCKRARLWFKERNIPFVEVDINATPGAPEQLERWTGGNRSTPAFDIEGDIIINFDESKVITALKKHRIYG